MNYNILVKWEEIKAYVNVKEPNLYADACYKAQLIMRILNDPINYMHCHFLSPVVSEFGSVNAFCQSTNANPEDMVQLLFHLHKPLCESLYGCDGGDTLQPL